MPTTVLQCCWPSALSSLKTESHGEHASQFALPKKVWAAMGFSSLIIKYMYVLSWSHPLSGKLAYTAKLYSASNFNYIQKWFFSVTHILTSQFMFWFSQFVFQVCVSSGWLGLNPGIYSTDQMQGIMLTHFTRVAHAFSSGGERICR